jgi:hypothetical protein
LFDPSVWLSPAESILPEEVRELVAARRWASARQQARESRQLRLDLRDVAAEVSKDDRLRICGARISWDKTWADIRVEHTCRGPKVSIDNITRCERPHRCPDCGMKIREERGEMIRRYAEHWLHAGGHLAFCTFTIARVPNEPMRAATAAIRRVMTRFARLVRDAGWNEENGVVGYIESMEWTIDASFNGSGHPHMMRLMFFKEPDYLGEWQSRLAPLWVKAAKDCGRRASYDVGLNVRHPVQTEGGSIEVLSDYMVKGGSAWGVHREMTAADMKEARGETTVAPFRLLELIRESGDYSTANPMVRAWREYEASCERAPIARKSKGLVGIISTMVGNGLDVYGMTLPVVEEVEEIDAEALAEGDVAEETEAMHRPSSGEIVAKMNNATVQFVHRHRLWGQVYGVVSDLADWSARTGLPPDYVCALQVLMIEMDAPNDAIIGVVPPEVN